MARPDLTGDQSLFSQYTQLVRLLPSVKGKLVNHHLQYIYFYSKNLGRGNSVRIKGRESIRNQRVFAEQLIFTSPTNKV